jgi:hypothetical protein
VASGWRYQSQWTKEGHAIAAAKRLAERAGVTVSVDKESTRVSKVFQTKGGQSATGKSSVQGAAAKRAPRGGQKKIPT